MKLVKASMTMAAMLLLLPLTSIGEEDVHLFSYHDGIPGQYSFVEMVGCVFWSYPDPYWDIPHFWSFGDLLQVRFYNKDVGFEGPFIYRIVVTSYPRHLIPGQARDSQGPATSESRTIGTILFESEEMETTCLDCWEEVTLNLHLQDLGYPVHGEDDLIGVFIDARSAHPGGYGDLLPVVPTDCCIDHPYSGVFASDDGDATWVSDIAEEYSFGDIMIEAQLTNGGYVNVWQASFTDIKHRY
jgi:hypothetical protein